MLDRSARDRLEAEIEEAVREHGRAQAALRAAREAIADHAIALEDIPVDLFETVQAADWEIKFYAGRLEELKHAYIQKIRAISF
jgi:hypothetical protein